MGLFPTPPLMLPTKMDWPCSIFYPVSLFKIPNPAKSLPMYHKRHILDSLKLYISFLRNCQKETGEPTQNSLWFLSQYPTDKLLDTEYKLSNKVAGWTIITPVQFSGRPSLLCPGAEI